MTWGINCQKPFCLAATLAGRRLMMTRNGAAQWRRYPLMAANCKACAALPGLRQECACVKPVSWGLAIGICSARLVVRKQYWGQLPGTGVNARSGGHYRSTTVTWYAGCHNTVIPNVAIRARKVSFRIKPGQPPAVSEPRLRILPRRASSASPLARYSLPWPRTPGSGSPAGARRLAMGWRWRRFFPHGSMP